VCRTLADGDGQLGRGAAAQDLQRHLPADAIADEQVEQFLR